LPARASQTPATITRMTNEERSNTNHAIPIWWADLRAQGFQFPALERLVASGLPVRADARTAISQEVGC
jgi:hypothetical protein